MSAQDASGPTEFGYHSDNEMWRQHPVYTNYEVSDRGRVRHFKRQRPRAFSFIKSYAYVHLSLGPGRTRLVRVHRMVLESFVGPCPPGCVAAHLNGIRDDNRVANLAWLTQKENLAHRAAHGTLLRGERSPKARLKAVQVRRIKKLLASGVGPTTLARKYAVAVPTINSIQSGRNWAWLR